MNIGDVVLVPVRDRVQKAVVTAIDVPEAEIESFRDQVKTIPSGSFVPTAQAPTLFDQVTSKEVPAEAYHCPPDCRFSIPSSGPWDNPNIGGCAVSDKIPLKSRYENNPSLPVCPEYQVAPDIQDPPDIQEPPGMDLVEFTTDDELAVRNLFQEGVKLFNFAQARIISTNEDLKPATDDLAIIKKTKTALEEYMNNYIGPIQDHLKQVRTVFVELLAPFDEADQLTRDKVKKFRELEQKKLALAREEAAAQGGEHTTELQEPVPDHTRTALGTQGFQKVHKWEVTDFAQVPDQYKVIDSGKVTGVVKGSKGTIEIPGIRIWTDEVVRINTK